MQLPLKARTNDSKNNWKPVKDLLHKAVHDNLVNITEDDTDPSDPWHGQSDAWKKKKVDRASFVKCNVLFEHGFAMCQFFDDRVRQAAYGRRPTLVGEARLLTALRRNPKAAGDRRHLRSLPLSPRWQRTNAADCRADMGSDRSTAGLPSGTCRICAAGA